MRISSAEIKELKIVYTSIIGHFPELEKELERLVKADDENMVLLIREDAWRLSSPICVNVNSKDLAKPNHSKVIDS